MGNPVLGGAVFVYPVKSETVPSHLTKDENSRSTMVDPLLVYNCGELFLELVHSRKLTRTSASVKISSEPSYERSGNGVVRSSSPKTPMNHTKGGSSVTNQLTSPVCDDSLANLTNSNGSSFDPFDITKLFGDEGVTKRLIEARAAPFFHSRCLLRGNLVTLPILSQLCIFRVVGAKKLSEDRADSDFTIVSGNNLLNEASESLQHSTNAFIVVNETKGVLLHGPPGTGKTSLVRLCVHNAGVKLFSVNGPELVSQYYGESERALHELFESACQASPAVVFIDELDAIAPARKDGGEELSQRIVATLLNLMDGIGRSEGVLVIAATNRPDIIEPALRRPGRLDREIEIGVPSPTQRLDILLSLLSDMEHSLLDIQVENLAIATHGFVGADLAALCNEAALICLRQYANSRNSCDNLHGNSIQYGDCDVVELDCLKETGDNLRDYLDAASSSISNGTKSDGCIHEVQHSVKEECLLEVAFEDFEKARMKVRPSAMREVQYCNLAKINSSSNNNNNNEGAYSVLAISQLRFVILEVPKVRWEDVGGQKEVKNQLMEAVEWPQKHQDAFKRIGTRPPTGVLMFGPPGCSKTLMARAVASEAGLNFLAVKGPELFSKWVGESEKAVRSLFAKARANAPSIIFFDEIDGLAAVRGKENDGVSVSDRVMSQLLVELDGLHQRLNVTVIAATNRPDKIDPALLRPGPPNESDREEIFRIHLRKIPCSSDVRIKDLSSLTEGFTGADISSICREAALKAMEENLHATEITMEHLKTSITKLQPSATHSYQELSAKFQRLVLSSGTEAKL
ncbi:hypothetical protein TIFTF001_043556 [Ficus carica]|uniref:AAA+ ATPase domain-containing protein n=1 Tax=Ficus carica TaxID=3494 RepID=A0AA87YZK8_FICCA|nr:hypothetical protein TIFTF001_043556 [Ficus carica]